MGDGVTSRRPQIFRPFDRTLAEKTNCVRTPVRVYLHEAGADQDLGKVDRRVGKANAYLLSAVNASDVLLEVDGLKQEKRRRGTSAPSATREDLPKPRRADHHDGRTIFLSSNTINLSRRTTSEIANVCRATEAAAPHVMTAREGSSIITICYGRSH